MVRSFARGAGLPKGNGINGGSLEAIARLFRRASCKGETVYAERFWET
ncbi:hypothetical protein BH10BAC4_BH10BAC4_23540 [soil metagenome]